MATTVTNATTCAVIWYAWCDSTSSSTMSVSMGMWDTANTTSTASVVWSNWNTNSTPTLKPTRVHVAEITAEQREQILRAREAESKRKEEELRQREAAVKRAEVLLQSFLSEEQWEELKCFGHFHVVTPSGTRYQIARGQAGNVAELNAAGKKVRRYCIHPREWVPDQDAMLAQKLLLETDEASFKKTANVTHLATAG